MTKKTINLALQGGGSHGAYSWGVLDRLIEEPSLHIEGISGTSAGAMNAAMLAYGMAHNGVDDAKKYMEQFWKRTSELSFLSPLHKNAFSQWLTGWNLALSPAYIWLDMLSRLASPYDLNPLNINPLKQILEEMLDFDALKTKGKIKIFATATHVASGQARVFRSEEITADVLLASACIPFMFQAVEIEGEHYWDGGYMGNPALWPLIYHCNSKDLVLVQINPLHDNELPKSAAEIINRLNEISFNSSLIAEMRAIDFVARMLEEGRLDEERYKAMRIHLVYSPEVMHPLDVSSKMNVDWDFLCFLKEKGRAAADQWLKDEWGHIGRKSTVNVREKFLCGPGSLPYMPESKKKAG